MLCIVIIWISRFLTDTNSAMWMSSESCCVVENLGPVSTMGPPTVMENFKCVFVTIPCLVRHRCVDTATETH
jgi:hypothetical protein